MKRDVSSLIKRFAEKGSNKFTDFQAEWQRSEFYHIHCIGRDEPQRSTITELVFSTMTDIATNQGSPMLERIAAVYVWYAVYCTQLSPGAVKVRLSLPDWSAVEQLHNTLKTSGHLHAYYVLSLLKSLSAFSVCAYRKVFSCKQHKDDSDKGMASIMRQEAAGHISAHEEELKTLQQSQQEYSQLKESLKEHLPSHLLNTTLPLDEFLSADPIVWEEGRGQEGGAGQEEEEQSSDDEQGQAEPVEVPRRRRVAARAYQSAPRH